MSDCSASKRQRIGKSEGQKGDSTNNTLTQANESQAARAILPRPQAGVNYGYDPTTGVNANHPPTNLPPQTYRGDNPYSGPGGHQMPRSSTRLPQIEDRLNRLESAVGQYVQQRSQQAVSKSILPGSGNNQK